MEPATKEQKDKGFAYLDGREDRLWDLAQEGLAEEGRGFVAIHFPPDEDPFESYISRESLRQESREEPRWRWFAEQVRDMATYTPETEMVLVLTHIGVGRCGDEHCFMHIVVMHYRCGDDPRCERLHHHLADREN